MARSAIWSESKESEKEAKIIKNILTTTIKQEDLFDLLLDKYSYTKYRQYQPRSQDL